MDLGIAGRKAIVCASSRGLGKACAMRLAEAGCEVTVNGLDPKRLEATAEDIRKATGAKVVAVAADVGTPDGQAKLFAACPEPDILITNNAGPPFRDFRELDRDKMIAGAVGNMVVPIELIQRAIDPMVTKKFGRIVNIGSINGQAGQYGQVNYAAAKSGIHGFTKALAQEGAAAGITVNAIAPGYVDTDMVRAVPKDVLEKIVAKIPMRRLGRAEDIARGVVFLVADDADFITGATLSINGGQHMY